MVDDMLAQRFEAGLADDMFDAAGVGRCGFFVYAEADQPVRQQVMAFIDLFGQRAAGVGQVKPAVGRDGQQQRVFKIADGDAYAGL